MPEADPSQFPAGMEYLARDPQATTYLGLATRLRAIYDQADFGSDAYRADVRGVITQAREAGIPEGHLGRISVLALSMPQQVEGN